VTLLTLSLAQQSNLLANYCQSKMWLICHLLSVHNAAHLMLTTQQFDLFASSSQSTIQLVCSHSTMQLVCHLLSLNNVTHLSLSPYFLMINLICLSLPLIQQNKFSATCSQSTTTILCSSTEINLITNSTCWIIQLFCQFISYNDKTCLSLI